MVSLKKNIYEHKIIFITHTQKKKEKNRMEPIAK